MKHRFSVNDAPYGNERSYNALRLARGLLKSGGEEVKVFLIGDVVACAKAGQKVPQRYYNIGEILGMVVRAGGEIGMCGTWIDARGVADTELSMAPCAARSTGFPRGRSGPTRSSCSDHGPNRAGARGRSRRTGRRRDFEKAPSARYRMVAVDRSERQFFPPLLLWLMVGGRNPENFTRSLDRLIGRGVGLRYGGVTRIDPQKK